MTDYEVPEALVNLLAEIPQVGEAVSAGRHGEVLRIVRAAHGLTLQRAGQRLGYSPSTLSRIETGHRPLTVDMLRHLAAGYQIPPGMLGLASYTVLPSAPQRLEHARRTHGSYAEGDSTRLLTAAMVDCPDYAADAMQQPRGGRAVKREQLAYHGDQPVRLSVTWVPGPIAEAVPALLEGTPGEPITVGISGIIEAATGRIATKGEDEVWPRAAWPAAARYLAVKEGAPVLETRMWWRDALGIVQYAETVTPRPTRYPYDLPG